MFAELCAPAWDLYEVAGVSELPEQLGVSCERLRFPISELLWNVPISFVRLRLFLRCDSTGPGCLGLSALVTFGRLPGLLHATRPFPLCTLAGG